MKKTIYILFLFLFAVACSQNIEPITYGEEACDFCSMTIVDKSHAAQVVTQKGKNYKFDATECMINYLKAEGNEDDMLHILAADYLNPGDILDARKASFIVSENIPSPMGAFLSAVETIEQAEQLKSENGGDLFTWETIKPHIANNSMHSGH